MIELNFKGMCEDCKCADLEIDSIYAETISESKHKKTWYVRCKHEDACHTILKNTNKKYNRNNQ